jgi:hypothetical protein
VIFSGLRGDGQLDFAVNTEAGELTDRSAFAATGGVTTTLAAPLTCMSCHFDRTVGSFSKKMPLGTGAGCE